MPNGPKTPIDTNAQFAPASAMFSPGAPPVPTDPQPVRRIDFPAGINLNWTPRSYETFGFPQLRAFSNVELVRLAVETRKDQIEKLDWQIKPRKGRAVKSDAAERMRRAEKFLAKPDGTTNFASWLRPLIEDLLVIDAPAIERRRDGQGNLVALDVIDGATIKLLVDRNGRRPRMPAPSYQQIIKGRIWCDLTTDDLIYAPRNMRTNHLYGFSPVEQIVVSINTILRRQTQQLAWFTEGNRPDGLINGPDAWTPDQLREFQEWWDGRLAGNQAERSKLIWTPGGSKYQAFKDSPIKDEFDEWLARVVCFAFSLPPTPFIRQMNKGTAQEDQERALEEGLTPLLKWAKRLFDSIIQDDLGYWDLEFAWGSVIDLDAKKQAEIHEIYKRNGIMLVDEIRHDLGRDPLNDQSKDAPQ